MEKSLGVHLRVMRINAGYSQGDIAKRLGYSSPQFVSNWERGVSEPPIETLRKLADIYGINPEHLFKIVVGHAIEKITEKKRLQFFGKNKINPKKE